MIAIAGPNLPHEILHAARLHAGPVHIDPDRDTTPASRWLESKFFPWAPAMLSQWIEGEYDHLDAVMFSRADDTSQRLYYYLCELQRAGEVAGPDPLIFDVAKIPRESSFVHTLEKVRALAGRLGVDEQMLAQAMSSGACEGDDEVIARDRPICLIAGSPPPDQRLARAVEAAGFHPVGRDLVAEWMESGPAVDEESDDPMAALARQLQTHPVGSRTFRDPVEALETRIVESGARAVVLWRIEEDEGQVWHLPEQREMLERRGIPHLVLTRRDWRVRDGADQEIIGFLQGVAG